MNSPDNAFGSHPQIPNPDDPRFNTDNLELVPLDGEAGGLEGGGPVEEVYTAEMQTADATRFSVAEKPVAEVATEVAEPVVEEEGNNVEVAEKTETLAAEDAETIKNCENQAIRLSNIDEFNPYSGVYSTEARELIRDLKSQVSELNEASQAKLAENVYNKIDVGAPTNKLIGVNIGSVFNKTLRGLEDSRLKRAGYPGLTSI